LTPQAVIFDFDGVIADSEPLHLRAYQQVLGAEGIPLTHEEYYARYLGFDDSGLFRALAKDRSITVTDDKVDGWIDAKSAVIEELLDSTSILFPGAAACIKALAERLPMAIASGALEPEIMLVLDKAGLSGCFQAIASASDGVRGKPAPDLYLLALAKLQQVGKFDAARCVAVEDSHWGLEAAKLARLRTVAITHTYSAAELAGADLVVDNLREITLERLETLFSS
jgi:beta-phosphoglucomutase